MENTQGEWVPLRQAIVEVARAYADFLLCEPAAARKEAYTAIISRLKSHSVKSRSSHWILSYPKLDSELYSKSNEIGGLEIPASFWCELDRATCVFTHDSISGEYDFYRHDLDQSPSIELEVFGYARGVEVTRKGLPLIGDGNPDLEGSDANFDNTQNVACNRVAYGTRLYKPRLPEPTLLAWWNNLDSAAQKQSQEILCNLSNSAFPKNFISRQRIRALDPGRKRGPKPIR